MTRHDTYIGRRPVLKGAGMTIAGLGGLTGSAAAKGKGKGGGKQQLEDQSSLTAALVFSGQGTFFPGYSKNPDVRTFDDGNLFDTTSAEITPNGQVIHYQLQFGADSKPYVLKHGEDGQYTSKGSVINVEGPAPTLGVGPGEYRATVRDVVQLYEKGGYFNWSVTRTDVFVRPDMEYSHSLLIIVWDEDGPDRQGFPNPFYRNNPFADDDGDDEPDNDPEYSSDVLGDEVFEAIESNANELIAAGPSNPGGQ